MFLPGNYAIGRLWQISAVILVEKDGEIRLTVAFHGWADEYAAMPDKLGNPDHFSVKQGNTRVGYVAERVGETDIGLAKLDDGIVFSNRFLDIDTSAKTLLLLEDISQGDMSRKSDTIFGQGTILELSMPHIGREVALVAQAATLVYINARPSQIAEMITHQFRNKIRSLSIASSLDDRHFDASEHVSLL
jgi:hypothetical protein